MYVKDIKSFFPKNLGKGFWGINACKPRFFICQKKSWQNAWQSENERLRANFGAKTHCPSI
jgi:hypothetical protein